MFFQYLLRPPNEANFSFHWPFMPRTAVQQIKTTKHRVTSECGVFFVLINVTVDRGAKGQWNEKLASIGGRSRYWKNIYIFKFSMKIGIIKVWWSLWNILLSTNLDFGRCDSLCVGNELIFIVLFLSFLALSARLTDDVPFWPSNPAKWPVTPGPDPLLYPGQVVVEVLFSPSSLLWLSIHHQSTGARYGSPRSNCFRSLLCRWC